MNYSEDNYWLTEQARLNQLNKENSICDTW